MLSERDQTESIRCLPVLFDGSFPVPCTQFYRRRCVAPCVESLCDRESYLSMVELVRLFLANDREALIRRLNDRMAGAAIDLDFEAAASFRDIMNAIEEYWALGLRNPFALSFDRQTGQMWAGDVGDSWR